MRFIGYIIIIFILIGLSFGLLAPLGIGWLIPGLPLLLVICIAMEYDSLDYVFFALLSGIWLDILYGLPIGSFSGAYLLTGTISYILFRQLLWFDTGWKYYLGFVLGADILLLLWLWLYTGLLYRLHWTSLPISGLQLWHSSWKIIIVHLIFAFPVYGLINLVVKWWRNINRHPLQLS